MDAKRVILNLRPGFLTSLTFMLADLLLAGFDIDIIDHFLQPVVPSHYKSFSLKKNERNGKQEHDGDRDGFVAIEWCARDG